MDGCVETEKQRGRTLIRPMHFTARVRSFTLAVKISRIETWQIVRRQTNSFADIIPHHQPPPQQLDRRPPAVGLSNRADAHSHGPRTALTL